MNRIINEIHEQISPDPNVREELLEQVRSGRKSTLDHGGKWIGITAAAAVLVMVFSAAMLSLHGQRPDYDNGIMPVNSLTVSKVSEPEKSVEIKLVDFSFDNNTQKIAIDRDFFKNKPVSAYDIRYYFFDHIQMQDDTYDNYLVSEHKSEGAVYYTTGAYQKPDNQLSFSLNGRSVIAYYSGMKDASEERDDKSHYICSGSMSVNTSAGVINVPCELYLSDELDGFFYIRLADGTEFTFRESELTDHISYLANVIEISDPSVLDDKGFLGSLSKKFDSFITYSYVTDKFSEEHLTYGVMEDDVKKKIKGTLPEKVDELEKYRCSGQPAYRGNIYYIHMGEDEMYLYPCRKRNESYVYDNGRSDDVNFIMNGKYYKLPDDMIYEISKLCWDEIFDLSIMYEDNSCGLTKTKSCVIRDYDDVYGLLQDTLLEQFVFRYYSADENNDIYDVFSEDGSLRYEGKLGSSGTMLKNKYFTLKIMSSEKEKSWYPFISMDFELMLIPEIKGFDPFRSISAIDEGFTDGRLLFGISDENMARIEDDIKSAVD